MRSSLPAALLLASASLSLLSAPATAETLADAIAAAYLTNPSIGAARAQVRQFDEGVPIAQSAMRPTADLSGNVTQELSDRFGDTGRIWNGGVNIRQPIWEGGRVRANVSAAEARIEAARVRLQAAEFQLVTDTVTAYADVIRNAEVVRLNENQVRVLEQQLRASQDRFEVGDLTRTDVAQSEARLAQARANLIASRGQQVVIDQAYQRLVGRLPRNLAPLPPLPPIPATAEQARDAAFVSNPLLRASRLDERAAADDVRAVKAGRLPSVGVTVGAGYTHATGNIAAITGFSPQIGVSAGMPLFTGGLIAAQVRQAQARQSELLETISQTERLVSEAATDNWALVKTADAVIDSAEVQVRANALAAEGVRQENEVGSRDILDVLNAEQELLNSRVTLAQAERDRYVATFELLEAMGDLDALLRPLAVPRYDPAPNSVRVRGKGWDEFGYDPDPRLRRSPVASPVAPPVGPTP